jgi:uncharacterized membrane protein
MAAFYALAGVNHFLDPGLYLRMMPPYLPAHSALVALSGAAEVALGAALLARPLRRVAAWGVIALLIAVFPANLHIALHDVALFGEQGLGWLNWARLPLQGVLIAWAWWHTRVP